MIAGPPCADDCFYTLNAELAARGVGTFPSAPLNLYPSLVSVVGMPPATPLLRLRAVDAVMAAGGAVMLFGFLSRWAGPAIALIMASGWSIAVNLPIFVESGFRNSIAAATLVYLGALWCLSSQSRSAPFWAGLLIPLAVALREPFVFVPIVSLYLAFALHGPRGLVLHLAGLAVAGTGLLLWIIWFRGSPRLVMEYFYEHTMFYEGIRKYWGPSHNRAALRDATRATMWLLPPAMVGLGRLVAPGREQRAAKGLAILLFVPPLPEPFAKFAVPYHWAQLLLGIVFLGAMGLRWLPTIVGRARRPPVDRASRLHCPGLAGRRARRPFGLSSLSRRVSPLARIRTGDDLGQLERCLGRSQRLSRGGKIHQRNDSP